MRKVIIIIISVVVGLFILIRIPINLRSNAYYYATHMPRNSKQYPFVPVLLGHRLPSNYVPGYEIKNIGSTRGPLIMEIDKKNVKAGGDILKISEHFITYIPKKANYYNRYTIFITEDGSYDGYEKGKNIPVYSKKLTVNHLNRVQKEIKQNTPKPKVNLQWIWNLWFKIHYR